MKNSERRLKWVSAACLLLVNLTAWAVDIGINISSAPTTYEPGSTQNNAYTIVVSKTNGSADITNIEATLSFNGTANIVNSLSWSCSGAGSSTCTALGTENGDSFTVDLDLIGDDDVTIDIDNVDFNSDLTADLTFDAEITDSGDDGMTPNNDGTSGNDTDQANLDRASVTNLSVSLTDGSTTYTPGNSTSYVMTVANAGPSYADNIAISQAALPSGLTITSWSCTSVTNGSCTPANDTGNLSLSLDLDASGQAQITINGDYASVATTNPLVYTVQTALTDADATGTSPNASDSNTLNLVSNLAIAVDTQVSATTEYTPGTSETYEVVVTNNGPSDVVGLLVQDNNPTEFSAISWTCENEDTSPCNNPSGASNLNTTVNIPASSFVTYTVDVDFDPAATTANLNYQVTATNPGGVSGTSPVNDSKSLALDLVSNLALTLTDSATTYTPGLGGTFTAVLTNNGPSNVVGVTVVDNNVAEFATIGWTCAFTDMDSDCPAGTTNAAINTTVDIAAGDAVTFTINVGFASNAFVNPLVYELTATNPGGVSGTSPVTATDDDDVLDRHVDLSITKTGKVGSVVPNEPFTYTIVVTNAGPSDLGAAVDGMGDPTEDGVLLTDVLDPTLLDHPALCTAGDGEPCWEYCSSDDGVPGSAISPDNCPVSVEVSQDSGDQLNFPIRLAAGSSSEIRIFARIGASSGGDCDPGTMATNEVCNTASIALQDAFTTNIGSQNPLADSHSNEIVIGTDIIVTKTDGLTNAAPGTDVTYSIVVRNDGFIDAQGVSVVDNLPIFAGSGAGFNAGSVSWTCQTSDANACCNTQSTACGLGSPTTPVDSDVLNASVDLGALSEVEFTVTATIADNATGTLVNSADATLPGNITENDPGNNTGTDNDTVLSAVSDVSVSKSLELAEINAIDDTVTDFEYLIEVTNLGPSVANGIDVVDLLDSTEYDITTASWTCAIIGTGSCLTAGPVLGAPLNTEVDLAVGATAQFTINISTNPSAQGSVVNIVNVTPAGFDPVPINNTDSVEYSLTGTAQLTIDNDDALLSATPGLPTNYTVKVTNEGPDNVFGATVENLFPAALTDVQWTCSAVSPIPGDLTFFQSSDQSAAGTVMALSPDGSHIYVATPDPDASSPFDSVINIFERNTTPGAQFGQLSFVGDASMVDGIELVQAFAISDDGAYLYALSDVFVGSASVPAIATFNRNNNRLSPAFGELTFLGVMTDNVPADPVDLLISSDQAHIYVSGDDTIQRYVRDAGTGLLTHETTNALLDAGQLAQSPAGNQLYVVDLLGSDVTALSRDDDDMSGTYGDITFLNTASDASIDQVADVVLSADGRNLYLSAIGSSQVVVLNRNISTGEISYAVSYNDTNLLFNATETLVGLTQLSISVDGEHLFITNPAENALLVLSRNSQGLLNKDQKVSRPGLEGVSDVVVSQDGKHVLVTAAGSGGKSLTQFDRRQPDPTFAFIEAEFDGVDDPVDPSGVADGLLGASAVAVSDDGNHVYVTGIGDNALAVFERDKTKGATVATRGEHLLYLARYVNGESGITGLQDVDSLVITPNGDYIYVGSSDNATLAVFARASNGLLTHVTTYQHTSNVNDGLLGVSGMAVDSTSQHLYVAGRFEASVAHYTIDGGGLLTLQGAVANGDTGVSGLAGARSIAISNDEKHLIVASSIDDSVVVLSRDLALGTINFQQRVSAVGDQPMDVALSPDGEHVYVVSANDSRLTLLRRVTNEALPEFGNLTVVTSYVDNVGGFNELQGARSVAVSGNGEKVYVGAEFDAAITIMDRDQNPNSSSFGQVAVIEERVDDVDGVDGLNQLYDLTVSRDSRHVYAVGFGDNALAAFVLGAGSSCSAQGSGNILDVVDIGSNGTLTYTIGATIRPNATGTLVTEARILPPENFTVVAPVDICSTAAERSDDNCDQDSTNLIPVTDLAISKTNSKLSSVAGEPVTYEIVVSNLGPSDAISSATERIMVKDVLNSNFDLGTANWTCEAVGSGSLSFIQSVIDGEDNVVGLQGVSAVAYSENLAGLGPHLLATSVTDNGLLAFAVNPVNGELSQVLQLGTYVTATTGINLTGARDVLVIDDDVYVASQVDDSLVAFKAVDNSGLELQWVANFDFAGGVSGLNQAVAVASSADGAHVYVAGANDNAVVAFDRSLVDGSLSNPVTISQNGQGLSGVNDLAISVDGFSAYTSGFNNDQLGVYQRDPMTGALTFASVVASPTAEFNNITSVSLSADDQQVYVTSAGNNRLYVFNRDTSVSTGSSDYGSLTLAQVLEQNVDGVVGFLQPSNAQSSADGRHVYVSTQQSDAVVWLVRDLVSGELAFGGLISDVVGNVNGLDGAIDVAISDSGEFVYVAGSLDHGIAVLSRVSDSFCPAAGLGNIAVDEMGIEAGIPVDLAVNGSLKFTFNATVAANATGTLINIASVHSCELPLVDPIESCVGADPNSSNNTATDSDELNPTADLMISKSDGVSQYAGLAGATQVAGDNKFIYVAARQDNAISLFSRQDNSGEADYGGLTYLGNVQNGVDGVSGLLAVSDLLLSDDGLTLYAAGSGDNSVVMFRRNLSDGSLEFIEKYSSGVFGVTGIEGVDALSVSGDGAHLYANGPLTGSMAVFSIEQTPGPDQGKLTFIQSLQNGVAGVSGLNNVNDVLATSDGSHVYATSETDNSISVFLRNPNAASISFGELSYLNTYTNGVGGVAGLAGAGVMKLVGDHLYVLGGVDQALALFERDPGNGELSFVEFKQNGTSGVVGLNLARDLYVSQDELNVYVAGYQENSLVRFDRDAVDGTLTFGDVVVDGDPLGLPGVFVDGLTQVSGILVAEDDAHVYVVAAGDDSVAVFERDMGVPPSLGELTQLDVLLNGSGGVAPGTELTYLITVSNAGPSDVEKARIVDIFPPQFEGISYQCFPENGAACDTSIKTGNVDELADLPAGSRVEIRATGVVRADASGTLSNTATVASSTNPAFAVTDPDLTNNTATDDDTVLFVATDLVVTKDNGLSEVIPGTAVNYVITVTNDSVLPGNSIPASVSDVVVTDLVPETISNVTWTCQAFPQPGLLDDGDGDDMTNVFTAFTDLQWFNDMVISSDGEVAYAAGLDGGVSTLIKYQRNSRSGQLVEAQRLDENTAGVNGLAGVQGLALSADGNQLYAVSDIEDALVTFDVDMSTGDLSYAGIQIDGLGGVNGLGGAVDVVLSLDGRHVYAAGKLDNAIAVFDRNTSTGALTFSDVLTGVEGLSGVQAMTFDGTGQYLVVVAEANNSLAVFSRSAVNGLLTPADVIQDFQLLDSVLEGPRDVAILGNRIHVASFLSNAIALFELNLSDGSLTFEDYWQDGVDGVTDLQGPQSLIFSASGEELYVASSVSEAITLFNNQGAELQQVSTVYDTSLIPELDGLSRLVIGPNGVHIYALSDELVLTKRLPGSKCALTGDGNLNDLADISSGGSVVYSLTGDVAATASGSLSNTATALMSGDATELVPGDNTSTDTDTLTPHSDLSITKTDGLLEVVAGTPLSYELSVFSAGPSALNATVEDLMPIFPGSTAGFSTGSVVWGCAASNTIQFNQTYPGDLLNGLADATDAVKSSDGLFVYFISSNGSVAVYASDISGQLSFIEIINEGDSNGAGTVTGLLGARAIVLDQEDDFVYVAGEDSNSVVVFARDGLTGTLSYVETVTSGSNGVSGMQTPTALGITPDNLGLYVAANGSDAITVFTRDPLTGQLSFVERVRDGFGTIVPESNVIIEITDLAISADGQHLYTAADFSAALAVFEIDADTKSLTFLEVIRTGDDHGGLTVPALDNLNHVILSKNGSYLYGLTRDPGSIVRFSRTAATGSLSFESVLANGDAGAGSLQSPSSISLTPSGSRLFVTDPATVTISLYDRNISSGELTLLEEYERDTIGTDNQAINLINDGVNVLVMYQNADLLETLRITASAVCNGTGGTEDAVTVPLYMTPTSAANLQIQALVHPSARGTITNVADILPEAGAVDSNLLNNSDFDDTLITVETDVALVKSGPASVIAGNPINYQITLTNTGPSDALGVVVDDTFDTALQNISWTCQATGRSACSVANGNGNLNLAVDVGADGDVVIDINATVSPAFAGVITNVADAVVFEGGFNTDQDLSNNSDQVDTTVTQEPDLAISKSNALNGVIAGESLTYQIVVVNTGPSDAPGTVVTDVMPGSLQNVSWTCVAGSGSTCSSSGSGDINDVVYLAANSQITYQVDALLSSAAMGELVNQAQVDATPPVIDPDTNNNVATDTDSISQVTDLEVYLEDLIDPYDPASTTDLPFYIRVRNLGPSDAENVLVDLPLQLDVTVDVVNVCDVVGTTLNCDIGYSAAGQVDEIIVNYRLNPALTGTIDNLAEATTTTFDSNLSNNVSTTTTQLLNGVDVRVSKTNDLDAVEPGEQVEYVIVAENIGSIDAGEVTINEMMPAGLINATWTCQAFEGATCLNIDTNNITGGADLPAGGRVELRLVATVDPALANMTQLDITNTVEVVLITGTDFNLLNNTASDTDLIIYFIFKDGFEGVVP